MKARRIRVFPASGNHNRGPLFWTNSEMRTRIITAVFVGASTLLLGWMAWQSPWRTVLTNQNHVTQKKPVRKPDVIYVPTPQPAVDKLLEVARLKSDDVVYDLGCGDGRIVVTAAKEYGVKAVGFEIAPQQVKEARANVEKHQVGDLVSIVQKDIFDVDLSQATVVTLFLGSRLNRKLVPQLQAMKPGSRVVSYYFDMGNYQPDAVYSLGKNDEQAHIYLWTIPLKQKPLDPRGAERAPAPREHE